MCTYTLTICLKYYVRGTPSATSNDDNNSNNIPVYLFHFKRDPISRSL